MYLVTKAFFAYFLLFALLSQTGVAQIRTASAGTRSPALAGARAQDNSVPFVNKTLPNGLEVIVLPDAAVPIVTVELAVRNGSFTESPELNGLSHLYEHMFFKPSQAAVLFQCERIRNSFSIPEACRDASRLKSQIGDVSYIDDLDTLGIVYNGSTREEIVNYYFTTTSPYAVTAMRIINDAVRFPRFDETDFENEKKVVIGELDRNEANPLYYLDRTIREKLFYKYPTRKSPAGTRETVAAATTAQMRTIQSRYYFPNNSALVVAGNVDPDEIFKLAEQVLGSWRPRPVDPFKEFPLVEHPPLEKSEAVVIAKDIGTEDQSAEQNVLIQIGWHGPSIGKDDKATYAADVFSYILQQPDSRFQRKLVDSGLASGVAFNYYTQRNVGPISLSVVTTPEKAKSALAAAYSEIAEFGQPGYFTDEELENSKTILESSDLFDREKPSEYAHTLGFWWSSTGIDYFRGYHKNLRSVTRADIARYVSTYIQGKPHVGAALLAPAAKAKANLTDRDLIGIR